MRLALCVLLLTACSGDEREPVGSGNPLYAYCTQSGYTVDASDHCVFTDGTSCPLDTFYEATCGQPFSYCEQHGGTIASVTEGTSSYAECTTSSGKTCMDADYAATHECP